MAMLDVQKLKLAANIGNNPPNKEQTIPEESGKASESEIKSPSNQDGQIITVKLTDLKDFANHPFSRGSEEKKMELADDIRKNGIIQPPIVRSSKMEADKYELVVGHRRRDASIMAELDEIQVIFREIDDDTATLMMVSSNFEQRDEILPVEKGYAYKMMLDALKRQGQRSDLTSSQLETKLTGRADDEIAAQTNDSRAQVQRHIRLTELIPALQERVNKKQIGFTPAVALSYLSPEQQETVNVTMNSEGVGISGAQAKELKRLSQPETLSEDTILYLLMVKQEEKPAKEVKVPMKKFKELLPVDLQKKSHTNKETDEILKEAMSLYREKYEKQQQAMPEPIQDLEQVEEIEQDDDEEYEAVM